MSDSSPVILNVDDNEAGRYAVTRVLRNAGFMVLEAATGAEALAQMEQKPDLVILDVNLPDIDGLEVCRRIKANPVTASTLVLQLSATAIQVPDRVRGLENGADVYLVHPLESLELIATVRALLRLRQAEKNKQELLGNLDRARSEAELLNLVSASASGEEDLEAVLMAALNHLHSFIPFTGGSIALVEADELIIRVASGPYAGNAIGQRLSRAAGSRSWTIIETGEPFLSNDLTQEDLKPTTPIRSYLAVPLIWRGQTIGLFEVDSSEPNAFTQNNLRLLQKAALVLSGSVEMTRRYAAERQALAEARLSKRAAEEAIDRTASLQTVTAAMSELLTPHEIMQFVIREGGSALGASAGLIGLVGEDGRTIEVVATYGYEEQAVQSYPVIPSHSADPSNEVITTRQPVWIESQADFLSRYPNASKIYNETPFEALAVIPLMIDEHILGALTFSFTEPKVFFDEDQRFLLTLAQNCAQTLERARLYTNLQNSNVHLEEQVERRTAEVEQSREQLRQLNAHLQAVREAERKHLSREIHDQLGGALTGLKMDVAQLKKSATEAAFKKQLETLSDAIDDNIRLIRQIATDLRPSLLDDFGVVAAIEWQLQDFQKRSGLHYQFNNTVEEVKIGSDASTALFRIFQETLTNIARHANATEVDVSLEEQADCLMLIVRDNGRGISTGELNASNSLGLAGMRERVHLLHGQIEIKGMRGEGTTVHVINPNKANGAAASGE